MREWRRHARRIGKKGVIFGYGALLFGGVLVVATALRYLAAHDLALASLATREFGRLMLAGVAVSPLIGAAWGWVIWKLLTRAEG